MTYIGLWIVAGTFRTQACQFRTNGFYSVPARPETSNLTYIVYFGCNVAAIVF